MQYIPRVNAISYRIKLYLLLFFLVVVMGGLRLPLLNRPTPVLAVDVAPLDVFVGPTYVDFWWDPADLVGCNSITLYRKTSTTNYTAVATPACGAGLITDNASVDVAYTYQFVVQNNSEPPTTIYLTFVTATPGQIGGKLHRSISLGGSLNLGGVEVGDGVTLSLSGATATGGSISDSITGQAGQGTVMVNAGVYNNTSFVLANESSAIAGLELTGGSISTTGSVSNANLDTASLGFTGDGTPALSDSELIDCTVSVAGTITGNVSGNSFTGSALILANSATAEIYTNTFDTSKVWSRESSYMTLDGNAFTGAIPDTGIMVEVTSDQGTVITSNTFQITDASGTRSAIAIRPDAAPDAMVQYSVTDNVMSAQGGAMAIKAQTYTGANIPNMSVTGNTVSRFDTGIRLDNSLYSGTVITASVSGNTIVSNNIGLFPVLDGSGNAMTATNNCIASNTTAGIWCSNTGNVIQAQNNYWGHPDGPSHVLNPDGLGDVIHCSSTATEIDFDPWLSSHTCYVSNLQVAKIETIQSVQTISNTIPLVAHKETLVRVYPDMGVGFGIVDGTLTGTRAGETLGTIDAQSPVGASTITDWDATRMDLDASLLFELPLDWTQSGVQLRADIGLVATATSAVETAVQPACMTVGETASMTITASFNEQKPVTITYIPFSISDSDDGVPVLPNDIIDIHNRIQAMFPVGDFGYRILPDAGGTNRFYGSTANIRPYLTHIGSSVRLWELKDNPSAVTDYYLLIFGRDNSSEDSVWYFLTDAGMNQGRICSLRDNGIDCLRSFGNLLGLRPLAMPTDQLAPPYNYDFPYDPPYTQIVGFDFTKIADYQLQAETQWDLMSTDSMLLGDEDTWISEYHYIKTYLYLASPTPASAPELTAATVGDYIYVGGLIGLSDGEFFPIIHLPDSPEPDVTTPLDASSDYCLQAWNWQGMKYEKCFDLSFIDPATGTAVDQVSFSAYFPDDDDINAFYLKYQSNTVAHLIVESTPPELTNVVGSYDATYKAVQVAWDTPLETAADLRYHVHYSADNGATWTPVITDLHPDDVNYVDNAFRWGVKAANVPPGTQAKLKLIATDGYNETVVTTAAFTVPDIGPWLGITAPANSAFIDTFPVVFEGYAYDVENGDRSAVMSWSSNRDGELGTGNNVSVDTLTPGTHTITLSADDGDGNVGTAIITITVDGDPLPLNNKVYLPMALR